MAMLVVLRRVSLKPLSPIFSQKHTYNNQFNRFMSGISDELPSNHGKIPKQSDYMKWENGGGIYHSSATIDRTALIETRAIVHSNCTIDQNVQIGSGTVVGASTSIGESTKIGYNVVLSNCSVGLFCVIHHGVCIGQDGFGFFVDDKGKMVKKPQMLNVKIGDHVEIGANTCIDRGRFGALLERHGYRRLYQTGQPCSGHNVIVGKNCLICGQSGIAGSATLGDYVIMGGRAAIKDHVVIASKVRLAANCGVTSNITAPGDYAGFPAMPAAEWRRQIINMRLSLKNNQNQ